MTLIGASNSIIRLYSDPVDFASHQVRLVCNIKDVNYKMEQCDPNNPPDIVKFHNPYNSLPMLTDRDDVVLYNAEVIIDYLEERFPHPPLYSIYPTVRAQTRLALLRIKQELLHPMQQLLHPKLHKLKEKDITAIRGDFFNSLVSMSGIFKENEYFMSNTFGILDCYLVPLLWRIHTIGVKLSGRNCSPIVAYMRRAFLRESFVRSCTREERLFMKGIKL